MHQKSRSIQPYDLTIQQPANITARFTISVSKPTGYDRIFSVWVCVCVFIYLDNKNDHLSKRAPNETQALLTEDITFRRLDGPHLATGGLVHMGMHFMKSKMFLNNSPMGWW